MTTTLYRAFDARDRLLYVGITDQEPSIRLAQHCVKPWMAHAVRFTYDRYSDRETAAAAELSAISNEDPVFNIAGRAIERTIRGYVAYSAGKHADDVTAADIERHERHQDRLCAEALAHLARLRAEALAELLRPVRVVDSMTGGDSGPAPPRGEPDHAASATARHLNDISLTVAGFRRRRAAERLVPLDCGCRDPLIHRCASSALSDATLDGWRDAANHVFANGLTPLVPPEIRRALWRRHGADRLLAERLHRACDEVAS
jgi:hypothetical protein